MRKFILSWIAIFASLLLPACTSTSSLMNKSANTNTSTQATNPNSAHVTFMRPSSYGGTIQSSVFDLKHKVNKLSKDAFVGIVSAETKVLYEAEPGYHLFMVIGENADFMQAHLAAGKTYYVLVTPRMGWWKARFSLKPIHKQDLNSEDFKDWFESTEWYENTNDSHQWAVENWESIQEKKADYIEDWEAKSDTDKAALTLQDSDGQ